jgi:hypothetical protein
MDRIRRVVDRGPLLIDERRAISIARYLRATGLYESVKIEGSSVKAAEVAVPNLSFNKGEAGRADDEKSLDKL